MIDELRYHYPSMGCIITRAATQATANEIERLRAVIKNLGRPHVCGGAIKPGGESCTRCGAEEAATELRSLSEQPPKLES